MNAAEAAIATLLKSAGASVYRSGWPDFLVQHRGLTIGIEVKSREDQLRPGQAELHRALEGILPVHVVRVGRAEIDGTRPLLEDWPAVADLLGIYPRRKGGLRREFMSKALMSYFEEKAA